MKYQQRQYRIIPLLLLPPLLLTTTNAIVTTCQLKEPYVLVQKVDGRFVRTNYDGSEYGSSPSSTLPPTPSPTDAATGRRRNLRQKKDVFSRTSSHYHHNQHNQQQYHHPADRATDAIFAKYRRAEETSTTSSTDYSPPHHQNQTKFSIGQQHTPHHPSSTTPPTVYSARECPCSPTLTPTYCLVTSARENLCQVSSTSSLTSSEYSSTTVCYHGTAYSHVVRNSWPVVVLWYAAVTIYLISTDAGRGTVRYVCSKLVCRGDVYSRAVAESIMEREDELTRRMERERIGRRERRLRERGGRGGEGTMVTYVLKTKQYVGRKGDGGKGEEVGGVGLLSPDGTATTSGVETLPSTPDSDFGRSHASFDEYDDVGDGDGDGDGDDDDRDSDGDDGEGDGNNADDSNSHDDRLTQRQDRDDNRDNDNSNDNGADDADSVADTTPLTTTHTCEPCTTPPLQSNNNNNNTPNNNNNTPNNNILHINTNLLPPPPKQPITSLPPSTSFESTSSSDEEGDSCTICMLQLHHGDRIGALPSCDHKFHVECLKEWIKRRNVCPLCQSPDIAVVKRTPVTIRGGGGSRTADGASTEGGTAGAVVEGGGGGGTVENPTTSEDDTTRDNNEGGSSGVSRMLTVIGSTRPHTRSSLRHSSSSSSTSPRNRNLYSSGNTVERVRRLREARRDAVRARLFAGSAVTGGTVSAVGVVGGARRRSFPVERRLGTGVRVPTYSSPSSANDDSGGGGVVVDVAEGDTTEGDSAAAAAGGGSGENEREVGLYGWERVRRGGSSGSITDESSFASSSLGGGRTAIVRVSTNRRPRVGRRGRRLLRGEEEMEDGLVPIGSGSSVVDAGSSTGGDGEGGGGVVQIRQGLDSSD